MTPEPDATLPPFPDPAAEAEWQRQQQAWAAWRRGPAAPAETDGADPAYAAVLRAAAADPAAPALPADFAQRLEARVHATARRPGAAVEWGVAALALLLLGAALALTLRLNPDLAASVLAALRAGAVTAEAPTPGPASLLVVLGLLALAALDPLGIAVRRGARSR